MKRRGFLTTLVAGLFGSKAICSPAKVPESKFGLGKYVSHGLEFNNNFMEVPFGCNFKNGYRYINFPIENILTIKYENGCETYCSFNTTRDTINRVNKMTGQELLNNISNNETLSGLIEKFNLN